MSDPTESFILNNHIYSYNISMDGIIIFMGKLFFHRNLVISVSPVKVYQW